MQDSTYGLYVRRANSELFLSDVSRGDELADDFAQLPRVVDASEVMQTDGDEVALVVTGGRAPPIHSTELEVIDQMATDDREVAVESARVDIEAGSHPMRFLYVPSTKGEGTAVFATNLRVGLDEAEAFCRRYGRRWLIENEYKSIKGDFLAKTSSKDYRVRLFYFVFAVVLYNIWRLTDFLLKADVATPVDSAPLMTAGECVQLVSGELIPAD